MLSTVSWQALWGRLPSLHYRGLEYDSSNAACTQFERSSRLRTAPAKDKRGVDLISEVLPFGRLWYDSPDYAIGYAMHCSRSHDAVIRVYVRLAM